MLAQRGPESGRGQVVPKAPSAGPGLAKPARKYAQNGGSRGGTGLAPSPDDRSHSDESRITALAVVALACVAAAGIGGYLAVRQSAPETAAVSAKPAVALVEIEQTAKTDSVPAVSGSASASVVDSAARPVATPATGPQKVEAVSRRPVAPRVPPRRPPCLGRSQRLRRLRRLRRGRSLRQPRPDTAGASRRRACASAPGDRPCARRSG